MKRIIKSEKDRLTFGKYKNKRVGDILVTDPKYLRWCAQNVRWLEFTDDMKQEIASAIQEKASTPYDSHYEVDMDSYKMDYYSGWANEYAH